MDKLNTPVKVVIADDHEMLRKGLRLLLEKQKEIEIIAEASNGSELIDVVEKLKPDVVITDVKMPVMDGKEACKTIKDKFPEIAVIALSMFDEENTIAEMLEAGASGYLLKNTTKEELTEAIKTVCAGETYFSDAASVKLFRLVSNTKLNPVKRSKAPHFTDKELQIISLICKEYTNKEIASEMKLSPRTVEEYRMRIQNKMEAKNMVGIVVYAIKNKLVNTDNCKPAGK